MSGSVGLVCGQQDPVWRRVEIVSPPPDTSLLWAILLFLWTFVLHHDGSCATLDTLVTSVRLLVC